MIYITKEQYINEKKQFISNLDKLIISLVLSFKNGNDSREMIIFFLFILLYLINKIKILTINYYYFKDENDKVKILKK